MLKPFGVVFLSETDFVVFDNAVISNEFLRAYIKYDQSVRTEATENLEPLLEYRDDWRLKALRKYVEQLSQKLVSTDPDLMEAEVNLIFEKELLEIEHEIISDKKETDIIDWYGAYISFPYALTMTAISALTKDPTYSFLALFSNLITSASQFAKSTMDNKYIWKSYLHEIQHNVTRTERLRAIDKRLTMFGGR